MRKENEIYCSNCGVIINIESLFCSGCGLKQLDFESTPSFFDNQSIQPVTEKSSFEKNVIQEVLVEQPENKIYAKWWFWLIAVIVIGALYPKKNSSSTSVNEENNSVSAQNIDICRCLTEPGNSNYMIENSKACDNAISIAIGVEDWRKVNMSQNPIISNRFDALANRCR